ncbi:hypothetical protein MUK42_25070 [Musa troglodytarum]|uniref:Uncharacterized protein n=1 Tax=Musa troglodytarum TaxID=320322 RepID=A0A9E7EAD9_9LILI|nr:hypothetical protein MUK42_25070 [Musa troglodytarum]
MRRYSLFYFITRVSFHSVELAELMEMILAAASQTHTCHANVEKKKHEIRIYRFTCGKAKCLQDEVLRNQSV